MKPQIFNPKAVQLLLTITVLFLTACGCTKRLTEDERWNPELPPITQTGANTFGCKINGKIMIPRDGRKDPLLGGYPYGVQYGLTDSTEDYDWIEAADYYTSRGGVAFKLPNIDSLKTREYLVKTIKGGFSSFNPNIVYMQAMPRYAGLYGSLEGMGKITITRYDNQVISGTFYCTLKNDLEPYDTMQITEGRFDFNKKTINTTKFR